MNTLTLAPYNTKQKKIHPVRNPLEANHIKIYRNIFHLEYHGFGRQVGLELSTNNTTVTMWPDNLAPNAAIVGTVLLHLSFVDVRQTLATVPINLLLGVYSLNLEQRGVWILVRLGPNPQT